TERREHEAQMIFADRMASIGTLAAGVAHEINNPLTYVTANIAFVAEELAQVSNERVPECIEVLREAADGADRVRNIVNDLKMLSHAQDDEKGLISVEKVIDVAANMAHHEVRHRARLVKDYGPTGYVKASEARLGQVLLNLLINAAHAIKA